MLSDQGYDGKKADVWSIGVILYVLLAGFLPFDESTIVQLFAKIQNADFTYPSWFTPELRSLLNQMLVADPKARITLSQLKTHPWYTGGEAPAAADHHDHDNSAHHPTEAQLEAAVQPLSGSAASEPLGSPSPVQEDFEEEGARQLGAPLSLNAFDLVSQCGGFMLDRMFSPEIFYNVGGGAAGGEARRAAPTFVKTKCYHFTSASSVEVLGGAVFEALESMGFDFETPREAVVQSGVLRASLLSAKGMVGLFVQLFTLSPALTLLEIKKGKGDILEWNAAYSELVDKRIAHLINKPKPE